MMRAMGLISVLVGFTSTAAFGMGFFADSRPTELSFRDASHQSTPIMLDGLRVNDQSLGAFPTLASARWMNPRGGKATVIRLPWRGDSDHVLDIETEWTEIETGRAYSAEVSIPWAELHVDHEVGVAAYITFAYGRNGEFMLFTKSDPDPKTGQLNGREVLRVCGGRTPRRDQNYGLRVNEIPGLGRLIERRDQWMAAPDLETNCTGRGA
ncbi:hypothetical protein [uncultured Litoreibacter sp.]|uniref:hypothetical protein n=1 Tax=uncultured Litoreibacter sp. TaxID=1392394 RepID=UPI0026062182|nr:hypothetical protein [uncultured Litoreibacter sp.]